MSGTPASVMMVCRTLGVSRATLYRHRQPGRTPAKRGPQTVESDAELAGHIREVLESVERDFDFRGEGHRKVRARLAQRGVFAGKRRVLRVMRQEGLLAPTRVGRPHGPYVHDGKVVADKPDEMWGTDATMAFTRQDGWSWVFIAVDHCTTECVGIHAAKPGTRYEALEPIHQGVREHFGSLDKDVAKGLKVRHDHGPQYISDVFQDEVKLLGAESSPSFVASPQGNGVAERFIRTLKEQVLWVNQFESVEELRLALLAFKERYNEHWLIERHGHLSPAEMRRRLLAQPEEEGSSAYEAAA
jgi:transposase InsO family protein